MGSLLPLRFPVDRDSTDPLSVIQIGEEDADEVFAALSSNTARQIFSALYDEPQTASDAATHVGTTIQNTKYHLDKLVEANLVRVFDTWYSEQGREMKVYSPTHVSLVIHATEKSAKQSLRDALLQFLGAVGLLGIFGFGINYVNRLLSGPQRPETVSFKTSGDIGSAAGQTSAISPGAMFFIGGLFLLMLLAIHWYHSG